jgi:hypothetical protein
MTGVRTAVTSELIGRLALGVVLLALAGAALRYVLESAGGDHERPEAAATPPDVASAAPGSGRADPMLATPREALRSERGLAVEPRSPEVVLPSGVSERDIASDLATGVVTLQYAPEATLGVPEVADVVLPADVNPGDVQMSAETGVVTVVQPPSVAADTGVAPLSMLPPNVDPGEVQYSPETGTVTMGRQVPDSASVHSSPNFVLPPNVEAHNIATSPETGVATVVTPSPDNRQR